MTAIKVDGDTITHYTGSEKILIEFTEQELNDVVSALSFFVSKYKNAPRTIKAMNKLSKKLWKEFAKF